MFKRILTGVATLAVAGAFWMPLLAQAGPAPTPQERALSQQLANTQQLLGQLYEQHAESAAALSALQKSSAETVKRLNDEMASMKKADAAELAAARKAAMPKPAATAKPAMPKPPVPAPHH